MNSGIQIKKDIYFVSNSINFMIESGYSLKSKEIIELSQELDSLIVSWIKKNLSEKSN